jgi:hypothetical protein
MQIFISLLSYSENKYFHMSKFDSIIKESIQKFNRTELLVGDVVKFNDKAFTGEWAKDLPSQKLELLKNLAKSGDILRVGSVKPKAYLDKVLDPTCYNVDVIREIAPGLHTDVVTVPNNVLDLVQPTGENSKSETPVNDKIKREEKIDIKPHEFKSKTELPTQDTKLPQAKGSKLKDHIASYMTGQ